MQHYVRLQLRLVPHKPTKIKFEAQHVQSAATSGARRQCFLPRTVNEFRFLHTSEVRAAKPLDTDYELAIFRSATWPYYVTHKVLWPARGILQSQILTRAVLQTPP